MKLATVITTPEVPVVVPVALLTGSFTERLDKARALGYDGVELMTLDPDRFDGVELARQIRERELEVAALGTGAQFLVDRLTLIAGESEIEQRAFGRVQSLVEFAEVCGSPLVTIGSFRGKLAWGGDGARTRLVETLSRCAEVASRHGVRIALEPLNRYESDFILTAAEGMDLVREIDHPAFGLLLDTFHMNIEEADLAGSIHTAGERLWHVHLGDSNRLPPGGGHFDFGLVARTLQTIGYAGYLSAELLARPDPDTAARITVETMRRFVPAGG
jgi:5-keto-L-gluconate epimerase